jgi:hypothetical protein
MTNPGMQRRQIEERLLALARSMDTQDVRWLEEQAFADFFSGWRSLAQYYEWSRDTSIDAHILKLYMRFAVNLRRVIEDERTVQRERQKAKSALRDLNAQLDGVFRQIERNGGARAVV